MARLQAMHAGERERGRQEAIRQSEERADRRAPSGETSPWAQGYEPDGELYPGPTLNDVMGAVREMAPPPGMDESPAVGEPAPLRAGPTMRGILDRIAGRGSVSSAIPRELTNTSRPF